MQQAEDADDAEFNAMHSVYRTLKPLEPEARKRVFDYVGSRLEIAIAAPARTDAPQNLSRDEDEPAERPDTSAPKFDTFAELFEAAGPQTQPQQALVAAYWAQFHEGAENFDSQSINKELKNLGHGVTNITMALDSLKSQKPALVLQLKKSGTSQQARKTYKVTVAGKKAVEDMIGG